MTRILSVLLLAIAATASAQSVGTCAVQHCTGGVCTTPDVTINSTGASMIWMAVTEAAGLDAGSASVTDALANTWNHLTSVTDSVSVAQFYSYSKGSGALATSSSHKIHVTGSYTAIVVCPVSGTATYPANPFDIQPTPAHTSSATSLATGSITCSQPKSVIFTAMAAHATATTSYTINSGFTNAGTYSYVSGSTAGMGGAYLVQASAAPVNPTWGGLSVAGNIATTIACFKGVAGGGSPPTVVRRRFVGGEE